MKLQDIYITYHKKRSGFENKMDGMQSLNTSCLQNMFCRKSRKIKGLICEECYNYNFENLPAVKKRHLLNGQLLSRSIIPIENLPRILISVFRFDSAGELINDNNYINFQNIAIKNPKTDFTLWTKRDDIVIRNYNKKLKNLIHIYSSPVINKISKKPKYFDKVFTVFTRDYAAENNIVINCHKQCIDCLICYEKNDIKNINEIIKRG